MKNLSLTPFFLFLLLSCFGLPVMSEAQTQAIRGRIIDQESEMPLPGATVILLESDPLVGATTGADGYFLLEDVPIGRQALQVQYIGYESVTLPNVLVTSGKQAVVNIAMTESFEELDEVVITAKADKDVPNNEMAAVSARAISLEEVTRFAGGRNDIARLAGNFAGVSSTDDSRNDIVIRGNSPTGVLWRLEGIPIPNPNHFSTLGTTGGPVSALNTNLLDNSDFLTSAFPAEYGNANAGVFDVGFRSGNREKHEFTIQSGFTGIEAMAEGPLSKKKKGSFVVSYRYSVLGLVNKILPIGTNATPNYQDLSFKIDFGYGKLGKFDLFGIGGTSDIAFLADETDDEDLFANPNEDFYADSKIGLVGLKHTLELGKDSYWRTVVATSVMQSGFHQDNYLEDSTSISVLEGEDTEVRYSLSSYVNTKVNRRLTLRSGIQVELFDIRSDVRDRDNRPDLNGNGEPDWVRVRDFSGSLPLYQAYSQAKWRIVESLTLNAGLHAQYLAFNESFSLEPRASLQWQMDDKRSLTLGYGLHSQMVSLPILLLEEEVAPGVMEQTNKDLGFTRSHHLVLGYDQNLGNNWRLKAEAYYQSLFDAPVESRPSSYSLLNEGADFSFRQKGSLVNEGTGKNYGMEVTLEKFFSNNFYMLSTASVYDSKYQGSDGIERNTAFNQQYVLNLLGGREFPLDKEGKRVLTFDTKLTVAGGRYYIPVDLEATRENLGREVLQEERAFEERFDPYFRWDFKVGIRFNNPKKNMSQQFFIDLQNMTGHQNIFTRRYNEVTDEVNEVYQGGFFPEILYRLQF